MAFPINGSVLRLLDVNANRAREALRVLEDYARFVLNDGQIAAELKEIRHDLVQSTASLLAEAILHRDTRGDVGTTNKTEAELTREDPAHVVTAAGKRLGEALRCIEEFLKTISSEDASRVETLRYRFYTVEQQLARTLRPADRFSQVRLYVLITEAFCSRPWLETAEEAILGGADGLQLREKELPSGELLARAKQLVALCRKHDVLCVINDRPDIAILSDADGVHVGQEDLPAPDVRKLVGRDRIVGVSTHRVEQARKAVLDGADYVGVGPFFRSRTKPRDFGAGPEYAREVAASIPIPAVAIAGITAENVDDVLKTGLRAVAVSSAVIGATDVRTAAAELKRKLVARRSVSSALVSQTFLSATSETSVGQTFLSATDANASVPPDLEIHRRRLPHWRLDGSVYFVTFRLADGILGNTERRIILDHLISGEKKFYYLFAAVIMPDHVHVLLRPNDGIDLSRITKGIKGVSARLLNTHWNRQGHVWQDESWDRIVRDPKEFDEKLEYMLFNPVKAGLVTDPWQYDGWYYHPEQEPPE